MFFVHHSLSALVYLYFPFLWMFGYFCLQAFCLSIFASQFTEVRKQRKQQLLLMAAHDHAVTFTGNGRIRACNMA